MEINTLPIIWFWWIFMQFSSVVSIKNSIFSPFHWKCVFFSQYVEKEIIICLSLWLFLSMRKCRYIYWVCPWFDRRISLSVQWKTHWSHWYYNLLPEWKKSKNTLWYFCRERTWTSENPIYGTCTKHAGV